MIYDITVIYYDFYCLFAKLLINFIHVSEDKQR
jgi:hypothetical protein